MDLADLDYRLLEARGSPYMVTPPGGSAAEVLGLFFDPSEPTGAVDVRFAGQGPQLLVFIGEREDHAKALELAELRKDATVVRKDGEGKTYEVKSWMRDELSLAVLKLREAPPD